MTLALMCSNCALRSGCRAPSSALRLCWREKPSCTSSLRTVSALIGCPIAVSVSASLSMLFDTQISRRIGSPRVAGSTRRFSAGTSPGSVVLTALRPAPDRRTFPLANGAASRSSSPRLIVERARPVICETTARPPQPAALTSPAANNRRPRSSSFEPTVSQRVRIASSSIMPSGLRLFVRNRNPSALSHSAARPQNAIQLLFGVALVCKTCMGALIMARNPVSAQKAKRGGKTATKKVVKRAGKPATAAASNPLLEPWMAPFAMPPFDRIRSQHFLPAFAAALADNLKEVAALANERSTPSFQNTIEALERSGRQLDRVSSVFFNLSGTDTSPELQEIERRIAPRLAKHSMRIYQNAKLFKRVADLFARRASLELSEEQVRVLERYHRAFLKAGAALRADAKKRLAAIAEQLAKLATTFNQNVLADEQAFLLLLDDGDLAGLPDAVRAAAAATASARGLPGKHAVSLSRSSIEPFLQFSSRRDLREKAFQAWISRGANGGKTDNRKLVAEILQLRAERARLLGFDSAAAATLEFSMAKTPEAVRGLLLQVWQPARQRARMERDAL